MAKNTFVRTFKKLFGITDTWGDCLRSVKAKFGVPAKAKNVSKTPGQRIYIKDMDENLVMRSFDTGSDTVLSVERSYNSNARALEHMSPNPAERPIACLRRTYDGSGRKGVEELVLAGKGDLHPNNLPRYKLGGVHPVMYRPVF